MDDLDLERANRPNWPARILGLVQHLVEITVLGEVLIAVGMIFHPFPLDNMPRFAGMIVSPYMLVVGMLTVIPLACLAYRNFWMKLAARAHQDGLRRLMPPIVYHGVLALGVLALCLLPLWAPGMIRALGKAWPSVAPTWEPGAWLTLMLLVILARVARRPLDFYLAALILFTLLYGGAFWQFVLPKIRYIRQSFELGIPYPGQERLQPGFMVSTLFMPLRTVLGVLLPILAALYGIRRGFAWWKFMAAGLTGWLVTNAILYAHWPDPGNRLTWIGLGLMGALLFLMARLPGQRRALERLTGRSFAAAPAAALAAPRGGWVASLVAHGLLALLVALLAGFAVIGYYEGKALRELPEGSVVQPCSPALANAFTMMKPIYEGRSGTEKENAELALLGSTGAMSRATMEEIKGLVDPALVEKEIKGMNPEFERLIRASGADCYRRLEINRFVGFAKFLRGFMARANWRILQGRKTEALGDIEVPIRLAWMMNADPNATILQHLIAALMRGLALDGAQNYYLYYREDPAALSELKAMLDRNARMVRIDWPTDSVARSVHAFDPVVPYFEMVVPKFAGRAQEFYRTWIHYDHLVLGVALEAYRRDHGAYPGRLDELAPAYLERFPRDPFQGGAYPYENLGREFRLGEGPLANPSSRTQNGFPATADAQAVRDAIGQFQASRKKNSARSEVR